MPIAPSVVHRVEHGHHIPNIGALLRHAEALGMNLSTVFARAEERA